MVGIFKANNPFNTFILFVYGLLLKLIFFLNPHQPVLQPSDGALYKSFVSVIIVAGGVFPVIYPAIAYFMLFTQAAMFNRLVNDRRMIPRPNYLPGMSYLLITSLFTEWSYLSAPLIVNTFLLWIWAKLTNLGTATEPKSILFNLGIITGLSSFIYFPSLAFCILIAFGLLLTRPFKAAEWIVAFIGIITPYYFLFSYLYLSGKLGRFRISGMTFVPPAFIRNYWTATTVSMVLFAFFIGCFFVQANFRRQLVLSRKSWSLLLGYLGIAVLLACINNTNTLQVWVLTAIPLAAFIACTFFYPGKTWFPLVLHWLLFVAVIVSTYFIR
ncbi:MAG: hypothetical protein ABJA57_06085 [Ginsengibacter sp.]